jgi:DNA-binding response OmpR family regulator
VTKEEPEALRFGEWQIDRSARELSRADASEVVALSPKEYELLVYLAERPGRALSREQIMNAVWGYGCLVTRRSIDRFVNALRKKVEPKPRRPRHILTVREYGYRFEK